MINNDLVQYIKYNIFPINDMNETGHNMNHVRYVIDRSLKFAKEVNDINLDMVYTIASYHDVGHHIDSDNHEKISSEILYNDKFLRDFFDEKQIKIMSEAVYDHRASLEYEPRSIYGKIISSADRSNSIEEIFPRMYAYRLEKMTFNNLDDLIEDARLYIKKKYCTLGYASEKMYFMDEDYTNFINTVNVLCENRDEFKSKFIEINNIKI